MKELAKIKPISWLKFGCYGLVFLGIYYSTITWLVTEDWEREAYSYCWLILPVVLFLLWQKRDELANMASVPSWKGFFPILMGLFFYWLGELSGEFFTLYVSIWFLIVGICWVHLGWKKLKVIGFPLFFILTMFPVPHFLNTRIMLQLRLISSKLGVDFIQLYGLPAYREGNIIDLGFTQLQVVEACSGLNSLISLMVLSLLLVYFFKDHLWKRVVLFVSAIPLSIVTNSMRIAATAILYKYFGAEVAEGFFHGFSGLIIFLVCIPVLILEMKLLEKLPPKAQRVSSKADHPDENVSPTNPGPATGKTSLVGSLAQPIFIVAIVLLLTTLAFSRGIEFREKIPIKNSLTELPLQVGEWSSRQRLALDKIYLDVLDLSEYAMVDYRNKDGKSVNFYAAYYESQSKGESIHSPATCLPGGGWSFDQSGTVKIEDVPGSKGVMEVNRAVMQFGQRRQISYYWFPARGRVLTNAYQLKIFNFWDALTMQRTDGALVRLITPVYENEEFEDAEKRLQGFVRDIMPVLKEYLPGRELANSSQ